MRVFFKLFGKSSRDFAPKFGLESVKSLFSMEFPKFDLFKHKRSLNIIEKKHKFKWRKMNSSDSSVNYLRSFGNIRMILTPNLNFNEIYLVQTEKRNKNNQ